jgi:hypothetical protein
MSRQRSEKYRKWIASLPCCICLNNIETQACHIRYADARIGKPITGVGTKPDDFGWIVPMCGMHHAMQHKMGNERKFWGRSDPLLLSLALFRAWSVDDYETADVLVALWAKGAKEWVAL